MAICDGQSLDVQIDPERLRKGTLRGRICDSRRDDVHVIEDSLHGGELSTPISQGSLHDLYATLPRTPLHTHTQLQQAVIDTTE